MQSSVDGSPVDTPANHEATASTPAPLPVNSWRYDLLGILAIVLLVLALGVLILLPWLPQADSSLYEPRYHGQAITRVTLDSAGVAVSWTTENNISIAAGDVFAPDFPLPIFEQLMTFVPELLASGRFPEGTTLFRNSSRTLNREGAISAIGTYLLHSTQGDDVLAVELAGFEDPFIYEPPLHVAAAHLAPGTATQEGVVVGYYNYSFATTLTTTGPVTTDFGSWTECRQRKAHSTLGSASAVASQQITLATLCAQEGLVEQIDLDSVGNRISTSYTLFDLAEKDTGQLTKYLPPVQPISATTDTMEDVSTWQLTYAGRAAPAVPESPSTIAPVYVAAPHPYLLIAARDGPLVALDALLPDTVLWAFQTPGSIFSPPAIDVNTGRIYFGSSDKHLYTLSNDGLFLWSYATRDNIAVQPLVAPGVVVVAAEDGTVYALDSLNGALRWQHALDDTTIAAPAHIATSQGDLILIGGDDGLLKAIELSSGQVAWESTVDSAIRAPLHVNHDTVWVATEANSLFAFAANGNSLWRSELVDAVRTVPAEDADQIYLVGYEGWLYALEPTSGSRRWSQFPSTSYYVGPPLRLQTRREDDSGFMDMLVVASGDGLLSALNLHGELLQEWQSSDVISVGDDPNPALTLGPTFGGGAIWFGDDHAVIRRLGPPLIEP